MLPSPVPAPPVPRPAGPRAALRIAVVIGCVLYIWGAPAARQIFGLRHPYVRSWQMFSGEGLDTTTARFWRVGADGTRSEVDEPALVAAGVKMPRRSFTEEDARTAARKLCARAGLGADVRLELRVATRRGWVTRSTGEKNACIAEKKE